MNHGEPNFSEFFMIRVRETGNTIPWTRSQTTKKEEEISSVAKRCNFYPIEHLLENQTTLFSKMFSCQKLEGT